MGLQIQHIDRSIFEAIRLKAVAAGVTPDITTFPDSPAGLEQYKVALAQIQATKGFAFEIFGTEAAFHRGEEKYARIVLDFNTLVPGDTGLDATPQVDSDTGVTTMTQALTYEYYLDCSLLAENQEVLRTGLEIIYGALPVLGYIGFYSEVTEPDFLVKLDSTVSLPKESLGMLGRMITYMVPDVILMGEEVIGTQPPINEITVEITLSNYLGISADPHRTEIIIS